MKINESRVGYSDMFWIYDTVLYDTVVVKFRCCITEL